MQPKKRMKLERDDVTEYNAEDFVKSQFEELYSGLKQTTAPNSELLTEYLLSLKPNKKQTINEAVDAVKSKKWAWPLPESVAIPQGNYKFYPPVKVVQVGGVSISSHLKSSASDLLLVLREEFCEQKDYLNGRYIVKRALFLVHLIKKLRVSKLVSTVKFKYLNNDVMKPILQVECGEGCFNLIPCCSVFKESLLQSDRNAVRPGKLYGDEVECTESSTPYYNNSVLTDAYSAQYFTFQSVVQNSPHLQQVLTILKYWLSRKRVRVSGHVITTVLLHLHLTGTVNTEMSVVTLCKLAWSYLSEQFIPAFLKGIAVGDNNKAAGNPGLYIDTSANVCYNTDIADLRELARHAAVITNMLKLEHASNETLICQLSEKVTSLFDSYDEVFSVEISEKSLPQSCLQYCGVKLRGFVDHVYSVLSRAYTDRVQDIKIEYTLEEEWSVTSPPTLPTRIQIALTVNKESWSRSVDRGPAPETPESVAFREFWGEKSKLRRFQDGSIVQAVVWEGRTAQQRRGILHKITEHVLGRHAGVPATNIHALSFNTELILGRQYYPGDGEEQAQKIIQSFTELSKIVRNCSKIPLSVTSVQGVAPVLRHTELYPAQEYQVARANTAHALHSTVPRLVPVHEVLCHFELSGKWPEDVRALLRLKAALYLALKEELLSKHILSRANINYLDIARNGFVFRLRFLVPKEGKLRGSNVSGFWVPSTEQELKVRTVVLPSVSSYLSSLAHQNPAFPLTVRLLKYWVAAHSLSLYIPDIFCELITSHIFLTESNTTPHTATAAFLRVLSFLSSHDWSLYPVFINFNQELGTEILQLYSNFMITRRAHPDACVVCPGNEHSDLTRTSPTTSSLTLLKHFAKNTDTDSLDTIFQPSSQDCNIVIHLCKNKTGRECGEPRVREHHAKSAQFPVVEYEPARLYVQELHSAYGEMCLFLYNKYEPSTVRVVLRNLDNSETKFTVNNSASKLPVSSASVSTNMVKNNLDALISDFDLLGKGLVENIEVMNLGDV